MFPASKSLGILIGSLTVSWLAIQPLQASAPFALQWPIDCQPGQNCWVVNYFDRDAGPEAKDYMCGHRSYNNHNGVDIGLRDMRQMQNGVSVLAAAPGTVKATRDGEPDLLLEKKQFPTGKECGNGVFLEHGNGYSTQYCHLKKGSILVKAGDTVQAGQTLGQVGLSGQTAFPHVHLTVRQGNRPLDPFTGLPATTEACNLVEKNASLWAPDIQAKLPYQTGIVYNHGLSTQKPDAEKIREGGQPKLPELPKTAPQLIAWADIWGVKAGDSISIRVLGPSQEVLLNQTQPIVRDQARYFYYAGIKKPATGWQPGTHQIIWIYEHQQKDKSVITETLRTAI